MGQGTSFGILVTVFTCLIEKMGLVAGDELGGWASILPRTSISTLSIFLPDAVFDAISACVLCHSSISSTLNSKSNASFTHPASPSTDQSRPTQSVAFVWTSFPAYFAGCRARSQYETFSTLSGSCCAGATLANERQKMKIQIVRGLGIIVF